MRARRADATRTAVPGLTGHFRKTERERRRGVVPAVVDDAGHIRRPQDYRDRYQILGAYTVLNPKGNEMHYTYASPGAAESYRKNGTFADGTVLVNEQGERGSWCR